jgi:hypothetical protein
MSNFWIVTIVYDEEHEVEACFATALSAKKFAKTLSRNYPHFETCVVFWPLQWARMFLDGTELKTVLV